MLINKQSAMQITSLDQLPKILALNANAEPIGWLDYEDYCKQAAKSKILWSTGQYEIVLRGGTNAKTGKQSTLKIDSIIAFANNVSPFSYRTHAPALTNDALFQRDRHLCAYCGQEYKRKELTRDHVHPQSKGGPDVWENVVTACKPCNSWKDDMTLEQAGMQLIYLPYEPNFYESMILNNRKILHDQMEFLMRGVHKNSRLHMNA